MKTALVYYSLEGNTKYIANCISEVINTDILQLHPLAPINKKSAMKYLWGGQQVFLKKKPDLENYNFISDNYDLIIIGTPVWAWKFSPVINTFINEVNLTKKYIALYCCHAGAKGAIFRRFEEALEGNNIISKIDFRDPLKKSQEKSKTRSIAWANELINIYQRYSHA
ncbi:MAG: flavodoxin [bacterium]|nr:flavodoxin [bacterium]